MKQILNDLVTREEFKELVQSNLDKVVILKAGATWCGPCKRIKGGFMELFNSLPDNVILVDIDIDESDDIANFLKIKKIPTMMNFVGGRPMDVLASGNMDEVKHFFDKTLGHLTF